MGICDCPYDYYDPRGYQCGDMSAYVRTSGREPACFVGDVAYR